MKNIHIINLILGSWIIASPWLSAKSLVSSNVIVGITIVLLSIVGLAAGKKDDEIKGGKTEEKGPVVEEVKTEADNSEGQKAE